MNHTYLVMGLIITAFGGYVVASIILLKFPTLLHKKKRQRFKATHISHRGGAAERLENTIAAFRNAVNHGTEMLELDVQMTRDEQVVVMHDSRLERSTGLDKDVSEVDYQDLPLLRKALKLQFDKDHMCIYSPEYDEYNDRGIPLLKTVFEQFPDMPINIDVKTNNDVLIRKTCELVQQYNRQDITVWGNFSDLTCQKLYKMDPSVGLLFSLKRVLWCTFLFYTGLLPFLPIKETHYEMLMPSIGTGSKNSHMSKGARIFLRIADFVLMSNVLISHLKARGIQVFLWVLNDEEQFERAFQLGADGVMTDFPSRLEQYLENKHEREQNFKAPTIGRI